MSRNRRYETPQDAEDGMIFPVYTSNPTDDTEFTVHNTGLQRSGSDSFDVQYEEEEFPIHHTRHYSSYSEYSEVQASLVNEQALAARLGIGHDEFPVHSMQQSEDKERLSVHGSTRSSAPNYTYRNSGDSQRASNPSSRNSSGTDFSVHGGSTGASAPNYRNSGGTEFSVHGDSNRQYDPASRNSGRTDFPVHQMSANTEHRVRFSVHGEEEYPVYNEPEGTDISVQRGSRSSFGRVGSIEVEIDDDSGDGGYGYREERNFELEESVLNKMRDPNVKCDWPLYKAKANHENLVINCLGYDSDEELGEQDPNYLYSTGCDIDFRQFYAEALIKIVNAHIPADMQIDENAEGLCDGTVFHALAKSLGTKLPDLPHPEPKNYDQQYMNMFKVCTWLRRCYDPAKSLAECAEMVGNGYAKKLVEGEWLETLHMLTEMVRRLLVEKVEFRDKKGEAALQIWLSLAGVEMSVWTHDITEEDGFLEHPDNLRELVYKYVPHLNRDMSDMGNFSTMTEQMKFGMKFFEVHFGVPQILHANYETFQWRLSLGLYQFLQFVWAAEVFNAIKNKGLPKADSKILISCPKTYINETLEKYMLIESRKRELEEESAGYYKLLQGWITTLKHDHLDGVGWDTLNNASILKQAKLLVLGAMDVKGVRFSKITKLTAILRSSIALWNEEPVIITDQCHGLKNLQDCFQTVLSLRKAIEVKVLQKCKVRELGYDFRRELDKRYSKIRCWLDRWGSVITDEQSYRYNVAHLHSRQRLLAKLEHEAEPLKDEWHKLTPLYDGLVSTEQMTDQDELDREKARLNDLHFEFEEFLREAELVLAETVELEDEARDLDRMYYEQAALMPRIDQQLHEFYAFFRSRPSCLSKHAVQTLSGYVKDARGKLFEVAAELDALWSIQETVDQLDKLQSVPPNCYTSYKLRAIHLHWEQVLLAASQMDEWVSTQEKMCSQLDDEYNKKLNKELDSLVEGLEQHMLELSVPRKDLQQANMKESNLILMKNKLESVNSKLVKTQQKKSNVLFKLATPLHKLGLTTARVCDMMHCWDCCLVTVQLLMEDVDTQLHLMRSRGSQDQDDFVHEMCDFYTKSMNKVLLPRSFLESKICESEDDYEGTVRPKYLIYAADYNKTVAFSDALDPYGRITCSMWLDVKHGSARHVNTGLKQQHLIAQFTLLSDYREFVTDKMIKEILRGDKMLLKYTMKHITEYFGEDADKLRRRGVKCYDYKRFVSNLLGVHRKLPVNPN